MDRAQASDAGDQAQPRQINGRNSARPEFVWSRIKTMEMENWDLLPWMEIMEFS